MGLVENSKGGIYIVTQNFYGNINGTVIGTNSGVVNNNFGVVKNINPDIAELLKSLSEDQITKEQAETLIDDIAQIKNIEENKKESLFKRIISGAERLVALAQASAALYPTAVQAYEMIKGLFS
jgi:hypothetical protein